MKKLILVTLVLSLVLVSGLAFAARGGVKGADEKAYEHASDNAIFNRIGDWFATRGKSKEAKEAIIEERKAKRAQKRAEKEARKAQKATDKEARKIKKETIKAGKELREKKGSAKKGSGK